LQEIERMGGIDTAVGDVVAEGVHNSFSKARAFTMSRRAFSIRSKKTS
jgi:hypothetical protein